MNRQEKQELITQIATKRGFFFPTAEIYRGAAGLWTYGHLGTTMKQKWQNLWREFFLGLNDAYVEIEGSYILPKKVFEASGHLQRFIDPLTNCENCTFQFRADELIEDELNVKVEGLNEDAMTKLIKDNKLKCPRCGGVLGNVRWFNMMFDVKLGAKGEDIGYLSPETAQNPYLSFKRMFMALRERLPFGLAMIGKAFRNEISPRHGFFRLREFTQAELQIFFNRDAAEGLGDWNAVKRKKLLTFLVNDRKSEKVNEVSCEELYAQGFPKWYLYHLAKIQEFYLEQLKIPKDRFRLRELSKGERAFYNELHFDVEILCDTLGGFKEVAGVHLRGSYDLTQHQKGSAEKMEVTIDGKKVLPNVLELSFGVDRNIWALLDVFFRQEKERTLFVFPKKLVPIQIVVLPLVNKDSLPDKAREIYDLLRKEFEVFYDQSGSIGKLYRRAEEIGIPLAVTIDHKTLQNNDVTLRFIEDMRQIRIKIPKLVSAIRENLNK